MEHKPTVSVEPVEGHPSALWLRWESRVAEADVRPAFHALTQYLDAARQPVNVLVDLRANPQLPLQTTISETITGPFMHRNMGRWLVIGSGQRAQIIARVITKVGLRNSIDWFQTEAEALEFLSRLEANSASRRVNTA